MLLWKRIYRFVKKIIKGVFLYKKNVFKNNYKKNVLISYITEPFFIPEKDWFKHTNFKECHQIAKIFSELGFNVDVIDFNNNNKINYSKYDIIFGFGEPLEQYFYSEYFAQTITIFYGTGCHPEFSNTVTVDRVLDVSKQKGIMIPESSRFLNKVGMQTRLSSNTIILGNYFTEKTYRISNRNDNRIFPIPASFYKVCNIDISNKNYQKAKHHFLWFGSSGLIHKGLDILLDIFKNRIDITLHVCGPIKNEKKFEDVYNDYLYNTPNIKTYGFVNISSELFQNLMEICAFTIFPSASEGGSPSVITVMGNGGLIPIISEASGLDVEDIGYVFNDLNPKTISDTIDKALLMSSEELYEQSKKALEFANSNHSIENFSMKMKTAINSIILQNQVAA
ncbi:MAG: glycosyltransferase family 1 protein [Calditrichaeota bacterium]|nr:MAG: glycosyltransferase family 1 protein [Calditrichota bacterium]